MGSGMVRVSRINSLNVLMNGFLVGQWHNLPNGATAFQYADEWLATPGARPISLSLPLRQQAFEGKLVYNFFDNLLPDSKSIRARIQKRFQVLSSQPFDLLAAIGADCVGAIQLCQGDILPSIKEIAAKPLSNDAISKLLKGYATIPLGMAEEFEDFRISIAGAQEKTALLWHEEKWCYPIAATPTSHIFKLPIGFISNNNFDLQDSCENEWLCLQIAKAFGFPTANAEIQYFEDIKVLVVERFDRRWSSDGRSLIRLPQEDMCQVLGISPNLKYQADGGPGISKIMKILLGAENANAERERFFRSQILFWLLAATDGHAKNFSVYINPGGSYSSTPLYDVISVYPLMRTKALPKQQAKMAMALRGSKGNNYYWDAIQPRHFISTAKMIGFSQTRAEEILEEMLAQVVSISEQVLEILPEGFPTHVSEPILQGMIALAQRHVGRHGYG
jgi:serine/threonine-protein kinase HipA